MGNKGAGLDQVSYPQRWGGGGGGKIRWVMSRRSCGLTLDPGGEQLGGAGQDQVCCPQRQGAGGSLFLMSHPMPGHHADCRACL